MTRFPDLKALSRAPLQEIRECIDSGGLGRKRSRQIKAVALRLSQDFRSSAARGLRSLSAVDAYQYLCSLPGVGPKSALCIMMYSLDFDVFPVDTHIRRIFHRLGLTPPGLRHYQAQDLLPRFVPNGMSKRLHVALVIHGRAICTPRSPDCENCTIRALCKTGQLSLQSTEMKSLD